MIKPWTELWICAHSQSRSIKQKKTYQVQNPKPYSE